MFTQENLLVSLHSNGPTHGSFQSCDHNLQFHTWLCATAPIVWIARVRHIPSTVSLFIVLIFCERFISFRKSSRKHWMPISCCWPVREGAGEQQGREYGNPANGADKKKKEGCLYTNCPLIGITACFCWPRLFICTSALIPEIVHPLFTFSPPTNIHFYIYEKNPNRVGNNILAWSARSFCDCL